MGKWTRIAGKFLFYCLFLFLSTRSFSQNLLANGNFEEENICTEYKVNCAPEAWIANRDGFSIYFKDRKEAYAGERYVAVEAGNSAHAYQRTFLRSRLLCGLRKDHQYRLEFYVKSPYDILDSIGVLFTSFDFLYSKTKLHKLLPTLFFQPASGVFLKDSIWQKVSMIYTANGNESFITIANFSKRDIRGAIKTKQQHHFFVFIDDISLIPLDQHERLCSEWQSNKRDIYEQDERHEYLRTKIRRNNDNPPTVVNPVTNMISIDTLLLPDVFFASGKADLHKSSSNVIDEFCNKLAGKKIDSVVIEGHTDNTGSLQFNEKLSADRAISVETAIRKRMNSPKLLVITRGWADRKPIADNKTSSGRQQNRRVELFVYYRE